MSNPRCEVCGELASSELSLKNGSWAWEPVSNLLGGVDATELDGMLCAKWGSNRLYMWVHSSSDVERAQEVNR